MALRLVVWAGTRHAGNDVRPQRGDVVEILTTDQPPGKAVLGNPEWRVIDLPPSVTFEQVASLLAQTAPVDGTPVWFREQGIDLDSFEAVAAQRLGRPPVAADVVAATHEQVMADVRAKAPLSDPLVIR